MPEDRLTFGNIANKYTKIASGADTNVYLDFKDQVVYKVFICNSIPGVIYSQVYPQVEEYMRLTNQAAIATRYQDISLDIEGVNTSFTVPVEVSKITRLSPFEEDSLNIPVTESPYVAGYSFEDYLTLMEFKTEEDELFSRVVKINQRTFTEAIRKLAESLRLEFKDENITISPMNIKLFPEFKEGKLVGIRSVVTDLKTQIIRINPS